MSSEMAQAIRMLVQDRGISEELVKKTIEETLLAAYKKKYDAADNAVVRFTEDLSEVTIYAQKKIVEDVEDPVHEVSLGEALQYSPDCELGDELLIEINPREFDRSAVQTAKQKTRQSLREIQKDTLYAEYKDKVGELIVGYYQRERNGNIFVDLGKTEAILPKRYQSPREAYHPNDRIRALIYEVVKTPTGLQIVLSRTHTDFVRRLFELEVPEIYDRTVEIFKIVREPGYRIKMCVYSNREDVDPVGACVGMKGVRIQAVVRELEGEKIDVLKYDPDPRSFIRNALSPAEVKQVVILDEAKKQALAVVDDSQFSFAIGKQGLNVRLANRLVDWNIDVRTDSQFREMGLDSTAKRAMSRLFGEVEEEEISRVAELPGIDQRIVDLLRRHDVDLIETLVALTSEQLVAIQGLTPTDIETIQRIIDENIEIVEEETTGEEEAAEAPVEGEQASENPPPAAVVEEAAPTAAEVQEEEEETYECPECGTQVTPDMTNCPNCNVGLSFDVSDQTAVESE
jgi:transcription termination/antitermination protein NusA